MEQKERRARRRLELSWPIWVMDDEVELARGKTANISRSGAYFRSSLPASVETGMTVSVRIGVPVGEGGGEQTITGHARVVRLEQKEDEGRGVALHFSDELDPLPES